VALAFTAAALPSASVAFPVSYSLADYTGAIGNLWLTFGTKASGTPATFGDFASPESIQCEYAGSLQVIRQAGRSSEQGSVAFSANGGLGDRGFVAVFPGFPSGGDVPIGVAGPFLTGA
jgi:hypothetical protein